MNRQDSPPGMTHLQRLEAESIHIMREVVAESQNPVMLYSIGKDSAVCCIWHARLSILPHRHFRCYMWIPHGSFRRCMTFVSASPMMRILNY